VKGIVEDDDASFDWVNLVQGDGGKAFSQSGAPEMAVACPIETYLTSCQRQARSIDLRPPSNRTSRNLNQAQCSAMVSTVGESVAVVPYVAR
jgi:hypothetical protein